MDVAWQTTNRTRHRVNCRRAGLGPLFASALEGLVRGNGSHHLVHKVLARFGLYDDYSLLYRSIFETFGYSFQ